MVSRFDSVSLSEDTSAKQRAARRIAVLIVWAWVAVACGLGICTVILISLSAPWFGAVSLLLGVVALVRALSLRRKIAARLKSSRSLPDMSSRTAGSSTDAAPRPSLRDDSDRSPFPRVPTVSPALAATTGSSRVSSLSVGPDTGKPLDESMDDIPTNVRFTERELRDLGLDQWEPDGYRSSADEGGPGIGLWIGVGLVVLISVVVIRGRSARAKTAQAGAESGEESPSVIPPSSRDLSKISHSSLEGDTNSALSGAPSAPSTASAMDGLAAAPPSANGATPRPSRLGRFTPSPKLARFAVVPLLASFVLAYFAIRSAGNNTMGAAIPLALASFVALGVAFYLAPAS